jgi:general secretion pathway protein C
MTGWPIEGARLQPLALRLAEILLAALAAILLARLLWALITPAGALGTPPAAAAAPAINPQAMAAFDPFFRTASAGPGTVSSLDLALMGTRVDRASGRGSAILTLPDEMQISVAVGEEIIPGVRLASVNFDSVTLDNQGVREALFLDQSLPATTVPDRPAVSTNPNQPRLAADLQAMPRMDEGAITGFILSPKGSGRAFAAAGLQSGDVLTAVEGTPVASLGDPAALARRLDAGGLSLEIERGGAPQTLRLGPGGIAQ